MTHMSAAERDVGSPETPPRSPLGWWPVLLGLSHAAAALWLTLMLMLGLGFTEPAAWRHEPVLTWTSLLSLAALAAAYVAILLPLLMHRTWFRAAYLALLGFTLSVEPLCYVVRLAETGLPTGAMWSEITLYPAALAAGWLVFLFARGRAARSAAR